MRASRVVSITTRPRKCPDQLRIAREARRDVFLAGCFRSPVQLSVEMSTREEDREEKEQKTEGEKLIGSKKRNKKKKKVKEEEEEEAREKAEEEEYKPEVEHR